jgi:hypothetical protein
MIQLKVVRRSKAEVQLFTLDGYFVLFPDILVLGYVWQLLAHSRNSRRYPSASDGATGTSRHSLRQTCKLNGLKIQSDIDMAALKTALTGLVRLLYCGERPLPINNGGIGSIQSHHVIPTLC